MLIQLTPTHFADTSEILEIYQGNPSELSGRTEWLARLRRTMPMVGGKEVPVLIRSASPFLAVNDIADNGTHEVIALWSDGGQVKHSKAAVLLWRHFTPINTSQADAGRAIPFTAAPTQPEHWFYRNIANGECYSSDHAPLGSDMETVLTTFAKRIKTEKEAA